MSACGAFTVYFFTVAEGDGFTFAEGKNFTCPKGKLHLYKPTVDAKHLCGDERRLVRRQPQNRRGRLVGRPDSA